MRIIFTGGGTMGSVSPLLAVHEELKKTSGHVFLWLGSFSGPERDIVEQQGIAYRSIPSGKLRRYFDWRNFIDPLLILMGFFKSLWIVWRFNPDIILTAGSFVATPVAWAGAIHKKKIIVHQQDLKIGLSNRLMQKFATRVTVAFDELREKFDREKVVVTGNPVRSFLFSGNKNRASQRFGLLEGLPTLMVMGGGVGSEVINRLFVESAPILTEFCQVIHLTGKGEQSSWLNHPNIVANDRYHAYEFFTEELADAYAISDLVVCRAGFSTLTELSALSKPAIVIPIPDNQQVDNAEYFNQRRAIVYVQQMDFEPDYIINLIADLFNHPEKLYGLGVSIHQALPQNAVEEYMRLIQELA